MTLEEIAGAMDGLAIGLGFGDGYMVQGGDIGSRLARIMGAKYPSCKGEWEKADAFLSLT